MNKGNFLDNQNFPVSSETFDFMQNMILLTAQLTSLGGSGNYILSGCVKTGTNYSAGYVVINGEILPFDGGAAVTASGIDYVIIQENKDSLQVYDVNYPDCYTRRKVICGRGAGELDITSFTRVPSLSDVKTTLESLTEAVNGKASASHTHAIANITGLQTALNSKAASTHSHTTADINGYKGIILTGSYWIGDVTDEEIRIVPLPQELENDNYMVVGRLRSYRDIAQGDTGTSWKHDNDVIWTTRTQTKTQFSLLLREFSSSAQYLQFDYAIIQM